MLKDIEIPIVYVMIIIIMIVSILVIMLANAGVFEKGKIQDDNKKGIAIFGKILAIPLLIGSIISIVIISYNLKRKSIK